MAKVTNAFTTYDAQANREDLSDVIYNIDPFDTPMMTAAGRRNVDNVLYDWQTEALPAVNTSGELEGFELSRSASQPTVRLQNVCQINKRDATVSGTQDSSNPAGKRKEMAHQIALMGKALKRDCESILFGTIQARNLGNATTERATLPFINWLETNIDSASDATDPDESANIEVVDGTVREFTEDMLNDVLQLCYENGGEPSLLYVGPAMKRMVSHFTGRASARQMIAANRIINSVTVYTSDFGDIKVLPSRWIRTKDAFLVDPRYVKVAYLRRFQRSKIAKIGDADTEMILAEYGLQVDNEKAHGCIRDLNVAITEPT